MNWESAWLGAAALGYVALYVALMVHHYRKKRRSQ